MPFVEDPGGLDGVGWKKARDGSVEDRVVALVAALTGVPKSEITPDFDILAHVDSPDEVELVMEAEEEFDVTIPDTDAPGLGTVGSLVQYIKDRIG